MLCTGTLKDMSLDWKSRAPVITLEIEGDLNEVEKLKDKKLSIELKQYRQKRSLDANAYYWVLCTKIAKVLGQTMSFVHNDMLRKYGQIEIADGKGIYLLIPETKEALRRVDNSETYHIKPTSQVREGNDGVMYRTYRMLRGSSEYNTEEMSVLINGTILEAKELGIETLPPDQLAQMMAAYQSKA